MKHFVFSLLMLLVLALSACGGSTTTATTPPTATPTPMTTQYTVKLSALNGSGVSGTVDLRLTGNLLSVTVNARGLEPNQIHYQHIHGSHDAVSNCPTKANANANGIITLDSAWPIIGPVAFSFAPYTPADAHGSIRWSKTFALSSSDMLAITPLVQHVVVFH